MGGSRECLDIEDTTKNVKKHKITPSKYYYWVDTLLADTDSVHLDHIFSWECPKIFYIPMYESHIITNNNLYHYNKHSG